MSRSAGFLVAGLGVARLGVALAVALASASAGADPERSVVVLLFDGFAPAMVTGNPTPALDRMRAEGAWTHHFVPAFPTISLINGVTISTGCWPEHHGIVTNRFLDPEKGLYDHSSDADWLLGCEHLHQAAERQGVRSAALGWYGAYSGTRGPLASVVSLDRSADERPTDDERGQQVLRELGRPDGERPRLILAYFQGPDEAAHMNGIESEVTRQAVARSDAIVGRVLDAIVQGGQAERTTVVVTTDHGMTPVSHLVNIARILRRHEIPARAISTGTTSFLYLDDGTDDDAVARAKRALSGYDEFEVFRPSQAPEYAHLGTGPRVGDLVVSAHPPYFIEDVEAWPAWLRWLAYVGPDFAWAGLHLKASHGYPPDNPAVHGILYAWGAGVAAGREVSRIRAVDLHPTVTRWLGIEPGRPVDGSVAEALLP